LPVLVARRAHPCSPTQKCPSGGPTVRRAGQALSFSRMIGRKG
jgi:hypothetical protein